jgi:hypothetical protein
MPMPSVWSEGNTQIERLMLKSPLVETVGNSVPVQRFELSFTPSVRIIKYCPKDAASWKFVIAQ